MALEGEMTNAEKAREVSRILHTMYTMVEVQDAKEGYVGLLIPDAKILLEFIEMLLLKARGKDERDRDRERAQALGAGDHGP